MGAGIDNPCSRFCMGSLSGMEPYCTSVRPPLHAGGVRLQESKKRVVLLWGSPCRSLASPLPRPEAVHVRRCRESEDCDSAELPPLRKRPRRNPHKNPHRRQKTHMVIVLQATSGWNRGIPANPLCALLFGIKLQQVSTR